VDTSITNRIQEIEGRISGAEDSIEIIDTTVKDNVKRKKLLVQNIQDIQDSMIRSNLRIICIKESEDSQFKGPVNIFNKIIVENFPNLKKEVFVIMSPTLIPGNILHSGLWDIQEVMPILRPTAAGFHSLSWPSGRISCLS